MTVTSLNCHTDYGSHLLRATTTRTMMRTTVFFICTGWRWQKWQRIKWIIVVWLEWWNLVNKCASNSLTQKHLFLMNSYASYFFFFLQKRRLTFVRATHKWNHISSDFVPDVGVIAPNVIYLFHFIYFFLFFFFGLVLDAWCEVNKCRDNIVRLRNISCNGFGLHNYYSFLMLRKKPRKNQTFSISTKRNNCLDMPPNWQINCRST